MSSLKEDMKVLIDKHGAEAVAEFIMQVIERDKRIADFAAAAKKMNVMPYEFSAGTAQAIKGRRN